MHPPLHLLPFSFIINIFLFLALFLIPIHVTSDVESFKSCVPFSCGNFTNISYPFWSVNNQPSYCGHPNFKPDCEHGNLTIEIESQKFQIIDINQTSQLNLVKEVLVLCTKGSYSMVVLSHKSDVYSYGMMLLEMVGGWKNINADASHTSEIYFPHWVYNRLGLGINLRPDGVMDTEEDEITKRMTIVGLWCIQTFSNDRPTMTKVVEMLEVNMNLLEISPKPLLSSPTRSVSESCTS